MPMILGDAPTFLEGAYSTAAGSGLTSPTAAPGNRTGPGGGGEQDLTKTELAAYHKWSRNNHSIRRGFRFRHVTVDEAIQAGVDLNRVTFAETV